MKKLLVGTTNANKKKEIEHILSNFKDLEILDLKSLKVTPPIIVENGKTFRQNAVKKAVTLSKFFDGPVIADDSGIAVDALGGKPGVRSARFARKNATDKENNIKLLKLLDKVPQEDRTAEFVCVLAVASDGRLLDTFEGKVKGHVINRAKGRSGFGYDPLFVPDGHKKTFAEMTPTYKNRISHRARALKEFRKNVRKYLKVS